MSDTLSSTLGSILFGATRSIGGIIPDVTVREQGIDELEITQHPVEYTSSVVSGYVTDHAIKKPPTITLEYGWSNALTAATAAAALEQLSVAGLLGNQRIRQVYEQLLALQASRTTFQLVTGKRLYDSMLIQSLSVLTDVANENVLSVTAVCRQIVIVQTQSTSITPQSQQATPASTAATTAGGTVQPVQVPNSPSLLQAFTNLF